MINNIRLECSSIRINYEFSRINLDNYLQPHYLSWPFFLTICASCTFISSSIFLGEDVSLMVETACTFFCCSAGFLIAEISGRYLEGREALKVGLYGLVGILVGELMAIIG